MCKRAMLLNFVVQELRQQSGQAMLRHRDSRDCGSSTLFFLRAECVR